MFKKILAGLAVILGAFAGYVATRPAHLHVERLMLGIKAPPEVVYAQIADFHNWAAWSPWEKIDPTMKKTYDGPTSGVGAHYAWVGNKDVGEGAMTIVAAKPDQSVEIKLEFIKPFAATNATTFYLQKGMHDLKGNVIETHVVWAMDGENGFMTKAMGIFMDMDKLVGGDFERGLSKLKEVSEAEAKRLTDEAAQAAPVADTKPPADDDKTATKK